LREGDYLRERYAAILSSAGIIFVLSGLLMLSPLLVLTAYPQETQDAWAFMVPAVCLGLMGLLLRWLFRPPFGITLSIHEGGVIVLISWTTVILFSAWPFMSVSGMEFSRALFESVSGWTTTGLSVVDVTRATKMILLWRSIMQLAGGAGLAIIMMSAIVGPTGIGISSAEGRSDQLVPQVRQSARLVLIIYTGYAFAGALAYWLAGMSPFESLNHSFAAVSTGGFSTKVESIGHWNSVAIEAITMVLMVVGNLSFVTAWLLWRGKLRFVMRNGEVRLQAVIMPVAASAVLLFTCVGLYPHFGKSVRVAVFETISAITTTGFSTVSYGNWNSFGLLVLIVLMLIGGGTCSTAGGIKQFRVYLLWRLLVWEIKRSLLPRTAVLERPLWEGDHRIYVDDVRVRQISLFIFLYLATYVLGTLLLCACGYSLKDALFEFASAIGTVGLSVGVTSADMHDVALWAETIAMFLGRLEFVVVIVSVLKMVGDGGRLLSSSRNPRVRS
jgi:trk system potassium uptake protein TrkH